MADLVIARHRARRRALQPPERVATGQGRTILALGAKSVQASRQQRIMPKPVMVVQIFRTQGQAEKTLTEKRRHTILNTLLCPVIREASR